MSTNDKATQLATDALQRLSQSLAKGDSQALRDYLAFCARFHTYSFRNQLLIALQYPSASFVAGYKRWLELNRYVRKGEKGIAILVPIMYKHKAKERPESEADLKEAMESEEVVGFTTGYVFDVAQTSGEELPTIQMAKGDPAKKLDLLKRLVGEKGISLEYRESLGGAMGASKGGGILLLDSLTPSQHFSVLVHELAHELLHRGERRIETTRQIRELEAESVAYAVCSAIGLDSDCSFDYIRLYRGDEKLLAQSLSYIQAVVREILDFIL